MTLLLKQGECSIRFDLGLLDDLDINSSTDDVTDQTSHKMSVNKVSSCPGCKQKFTKTRTGIACSICSSSYHQICGRITNELFREIENCNAEWKCPSCKPKTVRRSIVTSGDQNSASPSIPILSSQAKKVQKVPNTTDTKNKPQFETAIIELNKKLQELHEGQSKTATSIDNIMQQMNVIQNMAHTLDNHLTRVTLVEDKANILEAQIQALTRRLDQIEHDSKSTVVQVNGIPMMDNEKLLDMFIIIANSLGLHLFGQHAKTIERIKSKSTQQTAQRNHQSDNVAAQLTSDVSDKIDIIQSSKTVTTIAQVHRTDITSIDQQLASSNHPNHPILVTFDNENNKNRFITAYRRKRILFAEDIGLHVPPREVKHKIFIFEYLNPNLRSIYNKTKSFQYANKFKYVWTKNGKIFLRRGDSTKIFQISSNADLAKVLLEDNGNQAGGSGGSRQGRTQ